MYLLGEQITARERVVGQRCIGQTRIIPPEDILPLILVSPLQIYTVRSERSDLRSERPDLRSERSDLRSERPDLRSERPDLRSERSDLRSEKQDLRSKGGDVRTDGRTDGRNSETGENRPVWNHRSSAPPGPLPCSPPH